VIVVLCGDVMPKVTFKAVLVSKSMLSDPFGGKLIKLELVEEREIPSPIMIESRGPGAELAREIAPVVQQVIRALPFGPRGKAAMPRVTLWLTEDEWDRLEPKPDIGDELEVSIEGGRVSIRARE